MSRKPPQQGTIKAIDEKRQAGWLRPKGGSGRNLFFWLKDAHDIEQLQRGAEVVFYKVRDKANKTERAGRRPAV